MTDTIDARTARASAGAGATTAGSKLKAAREAAGLSLDAVALQLKLAPRQVKALEDDDWPHLPGRTFIRGFARNYARFVRLDPDAVVALLPAADTAPALERPTLAASRRPMGEIPVERVAKSSAIRWLVALLLVASVAAVAYYELSRSQLRFLPRLIASSVSGPPAAPDRGSAAAIPSTPGIATSILPNPAASTAGTSLPAADANGRPVADAATTPAGSDTASASAPAAESALVLTFKGTSWVEVKDASGRIVVQMTGGPGMTQTVSAVPPIELALGNAPDVDVTFRGQSLDLAPYTRAGVARVALK